MPIIARIVAPDGAEKNRREIYFPYLDEYEDQLPINVYPITHHIRPEGIGVILTDGLHECEASLHRYPNFFYIGSAYRRLRSREYTRRFRRFLEEVGIVNEGTLITLEFEGYRIHIGAMNNEIDFHVPDREEFKRGYELFNQRGPRGIDIIWFEALSIVQNNWGNPAEMTRGISRLIRAWNRFYANFDLETMNACIDRNLTDLSHFRNRDINSLSEVDIPRIRNLFNDFLVSLQRTRDNRKSPVSVAKALSLIAPNFFPLWDSNIALAYGCFYFSDSADEPYIKFCHKIKLLADRVRNFVPIQDDRPLLKRIDEYNISKYTTHWI